MRDAVILPLLVAVAVKRHVVRSVGDGKVGEHTFARADFGQDLIPDTRADLVCMADVNFYAGSVVAHLPDVAFVDDVEFTDDLDRGRPVPDICVELKSLAALIDKCEAHTEMLNGIQS